MSTRGRGRRLLLLPYRVLRARRRLFLCAALGMAVGAALCGLATWRPIRSVLIGWDVTVVCYLGVVLRRMAGAQARDIRRHAAEQDEGRLAMLILTVTAGVASLAAIAAELGASDGRKPGQIALAGITILLSWAFIHMIFALHYAHEFYGEDDALAGGLVFPGEDQEPDYWDFAYFSFVIGMTSQVSDVGVTSKQIRRTVTAHGIVSFLFNVALVALTINVAAGAL
jgi:uncharacterized membrane protein